MKKLESFWKDDMKFSKILKTLIVAVIFLVIFLILIVTGQLIFLFQMFGWIQRQVRIFTGADVLIANGIAAILMATIFTLPIWGFLKSFFPLPQKHKKIYRASTFICFAVLFFALYFSSQNVFFSPNNGEPLKYYSVAPNGQYKFYSAGGYDRLTGDTLKRVTKDIVLKYLKQTGRGARADRVDVKNENQIGQSTTSSSVSNSISVQSVATQNPSVGSNAVTNIQPATKFGTGSGTGKVEKKSEVPSTVSKPKVAPSPPRILLPGTTFLFNDVPIREKQAKVKNFISVYEITLVSIEILDDLKSKFTFLIESKSEQSNRVGLTEPENNTYLVDQGGKKYPFLKSSEFPETLLPGIPVRFSLTFESIPNTTAKLAIIFYIGEWFYYNPGPFTVGAFFRDIELK